MAKVSNAKKILKGISVQTIMTILNGVIQIIVFAIMSRLLTREEFGYFALIQAIVAIFMSLSEAGVGAAIVQKKDVNSQFINTAFTCSLCVGLFFMVILMLASSYLSERLNVETLAVPFLIVSTTLVMNSLSSVARSIMQRELKFLEIGILQFLAYIISSSIGIYLAISGLGLYAIISSFVANSFLFMLLLYLFIPNKFRLELNIHDMKSIMQFGGWLTMGVIVRNIEQQVDKFMLSKWLSVKALGAYNRPVGFINTISSNLNGIFDVVLFPILSGVQDKKEALQSAYRQSLFFMNVFSMMIGLIFFFNADLIISIFLGELWRDMIPVFQIVSITLIFNINSRLVDCYFRSLAYVKQSFYIRMIACILVIAGIYIGMRWDVIGVAIASLVCNVVVVMIKLFYLSTKIDISWASTIYGMMNAWRFSIILLPLGVLYLLFLPHTLLVNICFAVMFGIAILCEFLFFPCFVGHLYKEKIYVHVKKYFDRW